ncbi:hypothetical protein Dsin_028771 [Dipteronia sinensis]|uniref:Uncharacterized protein n=1 Tax=Dipteronia sinensis TaxID=43782 RepID=A0AAD9ZR74_9ROSI|nr:hypothetical protein Dsin_028771 [Dipteronia sinensis]
MTTLVWNAQGLGNPWAVQILHKLKRDWNPNIMFLMETKNRYLCFGETLGYIGFLWRDGLDTVQERLDRGVQSLSWRQMLPNSIVHHLDFWSSDHQLILLEVLLASGQLTGTNKLDRRAEHIMDYQPISLSNVVYKIVAKPRFVRPDNHNDKP